MFAAPAADQPGHRTRLVLSVRQKLARASERRRSCSAPSLRVRPAPLLARSQRPCPTRFRSLVSRERNALIRLKTVPPLPDAIDRAKMQVLSRLFAHTHSMSRGGQRRLFTVLPCSPPASAACFAARTLASCRSLSFPSLLVCTARSTRQKPLHPPCPRCKPISATARSSRSRTSTAARAGDR